ncbi:zinc ABC transporter ATP-binding protein ZnuC [Neptunomonas phycophila]|jgi:zinc transport system ATP-binding protein|nr:zinc ABC transporter ATP-binding protein ZnuC [Neptunomonas phycophila]MBT3145246.1 zinc ABC transporter ATP-binding protein ZnuC [Neptunomonas phycophila]MDO6468354.1 zinc ABC transporter ATP-binding protein ZnuC [Neptunomonas phycophila]MDO6784801.1 zinc ABC transporter ATP-binding protein ZnuC [Neptunomonas phycophila]
MSAPLDIIRLKDVNVQFGHNHVLQQVNLHLHRDCITTLIGPNGAGKTTLVRVVLGLIKPSSGNVWRQPGLRIGYMPQKLLIDRTFPLTVKRFLQTTRTKALAPIKTALEDVNASHLLEHSMHDLSGGETQRVMLARALLQDPELLVLDEPVQGVDINGQIELYNLIGHIRKQRGCGVLMISHDLHLVMSSTDHVICLNRHVCCSGNPEHVSNDPSFREMFGQRGADSLALYSHHHNHQHDTHGDVIADHPHTGDCKH